MIEALEGVFSPQAEDELVSHLTDAILRTNDASDNSLARRRLTMPGSHMPADKPYAAGKPEPFINVARRVPTSSPNTPEKRRAFVTTMTIQSKRLRQAVLSGTEFISTCPMVIDSGALEAKPIPTKKCNKRLRRQVQRNLTQPAFSRPFQSLSLHVSVRAHLDGPAVHSDVRVAEPASCSMNSCFDCYG
jgi:hypothetical protein